MKKYDVVIIGGGIIGCSIAYELCKYDLKIILLERNPLLADETSKGNSGIIHGGFDPEPGKIEAKLNVLGNQLWQEKIFQNLKFPRTQVDSLILAFNETEMEQVRMLYQRGLTNKVPSKYLKVITQAEVLAKEPNLNPRIVGALLCTSSWAIDPVKASLAMAGAAQNNGIIISKNAEVIKLNQVAQGFQVGIRNQENIWTKNIINAAGHYADTIAQMAQLDDFKLKTRRGEYRILSRTEGQIVNSVCFMVPTIHGKGVIVAPMLDGRILVGPTAEENVPKAETRLISPEQFEYIAHIGQKIVPNIKMEKTEIVLAGSRPIDVATNDFIIRYGKNNHHFINVAGTQSPALSSAPAIALEVYKLLKNNGTKLRLKANYDLQYRVDW